MNTTRGDAPSPSSSKMLLQRMVLSFLQARKANKRKPKLPNLTDRGNAPAKLQFRDMSAETAFQGQPVKAGRVSQQAVKQLTDIFEVPSYTA